MITKKTIPIYFCVLIYSLLSLNYVIGESEIEDINTAIEINFPNNLKFKISGNIPDELYGINLVLKTGYSNANIIQPIEFSQENNNIEGYLSWETNTSSRYIPPGSPIEYSYIIKTKSGKTFNTKPEKIVYLDNNRTWNNIKKKTITMYYNEIFGDVVKKRSEDLLQATFETVESLSPLLGLEASNEPVNIVLFNDYAYMSKSLAPKSNTQSENLVTQGQAYPKHGVVLLLDGMQSKGTASHEIAHILVERAAGSPFSVIPSWLNEGIAEYANPVKGFSYQNSFDINLASDTLLPITKYTSPPGKPEDVILFYGQAEKIVEYMVENFGSKTFTQFIKSLKNGMSVNKAIEQNYGMSKTEIENEWRLSIGASTIKETSNQNKPKSTSSSIQLYTLDGVKDNSEKLSKEKSENKDNSEKSSEEKSENKDFKATVDQKKNQKTNSCGLSDSNEILMLFSLFCIGMLYKKRKQL
jgi:hypothetical protein